MAVVRELERGVWLDEAVNEDFRHEAEMLCHTIDSAVEDVVVCLMLFETARADFRIVDRDMEEWQRETARRQQREEELRTELGVTWGERGAWEQWEAIREQAARDVLRAKWAEQGMPEDYRRRRIFIHAREFVSSLALLQRSLLALSTYEWEEAVATKLQQACRDFAASLPGLKGVRDSVAHAEDRMRREAFGRKIQPKPMLEGPIVAPAGGAMIIENLIDERFGGTLADGTFVEVEVSDATTEVARSAAQAVFDALPWRPGHRLHYPVR